MLTTEYIEKLRELRGLACDELLRLEPGGLVGRHGERPPHFVFANPNGALPFEQTASFLLALWPALEELLATAQPSEPPPAEALTTLDHAPGEAHVLDRSMAEPSERET